MNRYPAWKYALMIIALIFGIVYTLPNFFGEAPAVQVSSGRTSVKLDVGMVDRIQEALQAADIETTGAYFDGNSVRSRFASTDIQLRARDVIDQALNPDPAAPGYIVALNLLSNSPDFLTRLRALPMFLGLDLRGGVHFLLEVDMADALLKRIETTGSDVRNVLRDRGIRHRGVERVGSELQIRFADAAVLEQARPVVVDAIDQMDFTVDAAQNLLKGRFREQAEEAIRETAIAQNITTLSNRVNELAVSEPVIQRQGADRIIVQLPGVQDTAKAKDILGRTATLEIRMVCEEPDEISALAAGNVPPGCERYNERGGSPILVRKQIMLTGENLNDAQAGFDGQTQEPAVHLTLDGKGARIFRDATRRNVGKRMAILLFEKGVGEVVTAPVIRTEIGGGRVQISGAMSTIESADIALLLRAGSLAAPMQIIEERTIGPSLGAENIEKGFNSVLWGFVVLSIFIIIYYRLFGMFSVVALLFNLTLLIAILSLLQATLTLPGMAAIALTLGMAIDANVLINERIRDELRNGASPQTAITEGYDRAWDTILDSNVTTLIAGVALLAFGSGPVRGFAVVHCIGILTSMFSAVFFSRGLVNWWYGRQKRIPALSIGTVWKRGEMQAGKPGSANRLTT